MLEYDSKNYDPPAPIAYVTLRNPQNGTVIPNVPLLVDTGADATLLPLSAVSNLVWKSKWILNLKFRYLMGKQSY